MAKHLAIFLPGYIEKVFKGEKTVEGRFSQGRVLPYKAVRKDDEIYLKERGEVILGKVIVDNALYYENLDGETLGKLRKEYTDEMKTDDKFWQRKSNARFATIIFLKNPRRFVSPLKYRKKDRRPWVVMES